MNCVNDHAGTLRRVYDPVESIPQLGAMSTRIH